LDVYPTRAAAEAAKGARGTVVDSLGKVWLLTIAEGGWRPLGGERIAEIGRMTVIDATSSNQRRYYMIDVDVDLSVNSANSICKAYRILCEADRFDFVMNGVSCRSKNINGAQAFAFPDDIRSKFVALLKSIASFTKQLASLELNAREIDSFLSEFFERRAYAAEARRVLREALSLLDTSDARVIFND
jgi:hypothetical protein